MTPKGAPFNAAIVAARPEMARNKSWTIEIGRKILSRTTDTPLRAVLTERPLVSAATAKTLTDVNSATIQRKLAWMQQQGLLRKFTGQGRFHMSHLRDAA